MMFRPRSLVRVIYAVSLAGLLAWPTAARARTSNDTRPGVVAKCGVAPSRFAKVSVRKLTARRDSKYKNIAVIQDDGTLLGNDDINLCGVAKVFYKSWRDDRHFLFVFAQGGKNYARAYNAYYKSVRNAVRGIGRSLEDRSKECGSGGGVLLGFANMNGTDKWKRWAVPVLDLWPLGVIMHELTHQWVAHITKPVKGIRLVTDPRRANRSHWQPLVNTHASIMYGNRWRQLSKTRKIFRRKVYGKFISTAFPRGLSTLDRYLMGALPASKVKSFYAIRAHKKKVRKHYALPGNTASGDRVNISIRDIQQVAGKRSPSYSRAQKRFQAAFILVVPRGKRVDKRALRVVEYFRKRIPAKFRRETGKVLSISTSIRTR